MRRTLPPANMSPAENYIKTVLPRTMSPRSRGAGGKKSSVRIGPLNEKTCLCLRPMNYVKSPVERN